MPKRPTIKDLTDQLNTNRELRRGDSDHMQRQKAEIEKLRAEIKARDQYHEQLRREVQWHKQLSQNLSEAICAHMRNR